MSARWVSSLAAAAAAAAAAASAAEAHNVVGKRELAHQCGWSVRVAGGAGRGRRVTCPPARARDMSAPWYPPGDLDLTLHTRQGRLPYDN